MIRYLWHVIRESLRFPRCKGCGGLVVYDGTMTIEWGGATELSSEGPKVRRWEIAWHKRCQRAYWRGCRAQRNRVKPDLSHWCTELIEGAE